MESKIKFYEFTQNNSGGHFDCDDDVCHRVVIQAGSEDEAVSKALGLGVYFDGCEKGVDCDCCGDRWSRYCDEVDIASINKRGYNVSEYVISGDKSKAEKEWNDMFGKYEKKENPSWRKTYSSEAFEGKITFRDEIEYFQFLADQYGWTCPDVRIFYMDGNRHEIFSNKGTLNQFKK